MSKSAKVVLERVPIELNRKRALEFLYAVAFSAENRYPPIARRKTRVNALMIKSGAGFFRKML